MAILSAGQQACAPSDDTPPVREEARRFGPEERRAAQALSIGQNRPRGEITPQYAAMTCVVALAAIEERMAGANVLSAQQQRAFAEAQALYRRRAETGTTPEARAEMRTAIETTYPDPSSRARFALGCLRDLA